MKNVLVGIGLLCFSSLAFSQAETELPPPTMVIKDIVYNNDKLHNTYRFPELVSKEYPLSARRINDALFSHYLQRLSGKDPYLTLKSAVTPKEGAPVAIPFLDYAVVENNHKYITLTIQSEYCGAYCEYGNASHSFDVTHGTRIQLEDIFLPKALAQLEKEVKTDIRSTINALIKEQKKNPVPIEQQNEDYVDYQEFYGSCWVMSDSSTLDFTKAFSLKNGKLVFQNGRCSNHAGRALDELGEFITEIALEKYIDLLTPYGKSLLIEKETATIAPPPRFFGRMLYGTINNKLPIAIHVNCYGTSAYGAYYYTKFGQPLELYGTCEKSNIRSVQLTFNSDNAPKEEIKLTLKNGQYQGNWWSEGKNLPIVIELP